MPCVTKLIRVGPLSLKYGTKTVHSSTENPQLPPTVYTLTIDIVNALVVERDLLKAQIERRDQEIKELRQSGNSVSGNNFAQTQEHSDVATMSSRSELTYLHIIGALLHLLLGRSPSGKPYSSFTTQESIISAMIAHHGDRLGIADRTLRSKFAESKRRLSMV